jgi:hypothetical protein
MADTRVECRSEFAYAEKPVAVHWQGERLVIAAILESARTPAGRLFRVRTVDGQEFELHYHEAVDEWQIHQP